MSVSKPVGDTVIITVNTPEFEPGRFDLIHWPIVPRLKERVRKKPFTAAQPAQKGLL
jgi:hypothetical protein